MSVATVRGNTQQLTNIPSNTNNLINNSEEDYVLLSKKAKKEENSSVIKSNFPTTTNNMSPQHSSNNSPNSSTNGDVTSNSDNNNNNTTTNIASMDCANYNNNNNNTQQMNGNNYYNMNNNNSMMHNNNNMTTGSMDSGPLPNEIFELLNEFWKPNEMVAPDTSHMFNGKFSRRSPEGSLDDPVEEEKEADDEVTSLGDADVSGDRITQKRRYSRLSDGYERLKSVLPSVKDKRRVSKARILDEAINYIQRLESVTNVLKREHEKRLSMMNGSNGFFPDYSVQPYMRSLFQKQMYPSGTGGISKGSSQGQYGKMNSSTPPSKGGSPGTGGSNRMKQYNTAVQYPTVNAVAANNMNTTADFNYNMPNFAPNPSNPLYQTPDSTQLLSSTNETSQSPSTNAPYNSACSPSQQQTPTSYQNGGVNNSWPYQGSMGGGTYDHTSLYGNSRMQNNNYNAPYNSQSSLAANGMWTMGSGLSDVVPHGSDHAMKVG